MTGAQWRFGGMEFQVLWEAFGRDRLPYPLKFRSSAQTMDDLESQRAQAALRVGAVMDERLHQALTAVAAPAARVQISDFHGSGIGVITRVHAVVSGRLGVLLVQSPGIPVDVGSDVIVSVHEASEVPRAVVAQLPTCPPGSARGVTIERPRHQVSHSFMSAPMAVRETEEFTRFFDRPRTCVGEVTVAPGAAVDSRVGRDDLTFHWNDYADDGRYLVRDGERLSAEPVSDADLASAIARNLAAALSRRGPF